MPTQEQYGRELDFAFAGVKAAMGSNPGYDPGANRVRELCNGCNTIFAARKAPRSFREPFPVMGPQRFIGLVGIASYRRRRVLSYQ